MVWKEKTAAGVDRIEREKAIVSLKSGLTVLQPTRHERKVGGAGISVTARKSRGANKGKPYLWKPALGS